MGQVAVLSYHSLPLTVDHMAILVHRIYLNNFQISNLFF